MVLEGVYQSHPFAALVDKIPKLISYDWNLSFPHTLREGNRIADLWAKQDVLEVASLVSHCSHPLDLEDSLLADAIGILSISSKFKTDYCCTRQNEHNAHTKTKNAKRI
ncbi:hypothetical protein JHK87_033545 [Glycine soja]|nr:hypothetical protein JHK87_033545 [Glycine soja]